MINNVKDLIDYLNEWIAEQIYSYEMTLSDGWENDKKSVTFVAGVIRIFDNIQQEMENLRDTKDITVERVIEKLSKDLSKDVELPCLTKNIGFYVYGVIEGQIVFHDELKRILEDE